MALQTLLFQPSKTYFEPDCENKFLLFYVTNFVVICYDSHRERPGKKREKTQITNIINEGTKINTDIYRYHEKCWTGRSTSGIKIARRNISNLRYADDTTLMAESQEKLKSFLMKVKKKRVEKLA